jgi:DNA primase
MRDQAERSAGLTTSWRRRRNGSPSSSTGSMAARRALSESAGISAATIARFGSASRPNGRNKLKAALLHLGEDKLVDTGMLIRPRRTAKASPTTASAAG